MSYSTVSMGDVYSYSMMDRAGTFRVLVCDQCGQPVAASYTEQHDAWHIATGNIENVLNILKEHAAGLVAKQIEEKLKDWEPTQKIRLIVETKYD